MECPPGRRVRRPKEKQKQVEQSPLSDVTQGHEPPSDFKSGRSERCERTQEQASETKKSEKAKLQTKRFSQGRKRPEGSGDSSDVVNSETRGTEQYDTREEKRNKSAVSIEKEYSRPLSREDSVSFNENTNEKGTRYQGHTPRKNSSKSKAKKNVTVEKDEEKEGEAVKNEGKSRGQATKDGQKCQHKKNGAEKGSVIVADRSDTTLPQYFRQDQDTTKRDSKCQSGATKQGYVGVTKRNGPKEHVISENSEKTLLENGLKMATSKAKNIVTMKNDDEKEGQPVKNGGKSREEATKDGQKCQHKKHEADKSRMTAADRSDTTLPQYFRQDQGTAKRDSKCQSGATKQGYVGVTKRNGPKEHVISENSEKTLLENGLKMAKSKATKNVTVKNDEEKEGQVVKNGGKSRQEATKDGQKCQYKKHEVEKRSVTVADRSDTALPQHFRQDQGTTKRDREHQSGATTQGHAGVTKRNGPKENVIRENSEKTLLENGLKMVNSKATKNVTVKKHEEKEGQAVKNGRKSREEAKKDGQKYQYKKHEVDKSSVTVADRSDTTLPQHFRQDQGTTKRDSECQSGAKKQGHAGVTKRNGPKEHVISENSEKTLLENGLKMAKSKAKNIVTVRNDEEKKGQAIKKGGKSRGGATKDGQKCQYKKHEADKSSVTVANRSDTTLPQHFRQDQGTTKRDSEYQSGATKQGYAGVTKRNGPKEDVISEGSGKTLLENGSEDGTIGTESTSKPENIKGRRRRSRARKKKVVGESDDKAMSQNNLRDSAAERKSESPVGISVLKSINEATNNDGVSSSGNILSHNVELNGVNEKESDKKGETAKRGKPKRGHKATENVVSVSQKEALSKTSDRDTVKGKDSEREQEDTTRKKSPRKTAGRGTEEVSFQSKDRTLVIVPDVDESTNKTLSSTCLQTDVTTFGMAKQSNKSVNENCDDNDTLHLSERRPENESEKESRRIRRRRRQTRSKAGKHSAIDGPDNALPPNCPNDCAVEQENKSRYFKDGKPGHQNKIKLKKSAEIDNNNNILPQEISRDELTRTDHSGQRKENDLLRGEETSLQEGAQDGVAELQAKQSSTGCRYNRRNFRHLTVIPTLGDISIDQSGSLRKNKIKGRYHNIEHYLDVQFQLLREDFLRPLRDGIKHYREHNNRSYPNDLYQDVRIYDNVKILRPICTSSGVRYKIRFDTRKFVDVQWENSKRLIFGSLLCLSKDNFENFVFATVAERNVKEVVKGLIEIRFVSSSSDARPRAGDVCQMVESIAFFGAYRPVLEGLQMMPFEEFPFKEYIVDCHKDVCPPGYLTKADGQKVVFDFSSIIPDEKEEGEEYTVTLQQEITADQCDVSDHLITSSSPKQSISVTVLEPDSWPNAKDLKIDDSQFEALQLALTKEFAIIQGPPGTGKTYIGLKIAKVLLCNQTAWSRNGKTGPMLVVCYTNHALDQFLEGILDFHPNGIIRVGGRSQSERIKELSLSTVKKEMIQKRKLPRTGDFGNIRKEMGGLSKIINDHHRKLGELKRILFHEDELKANASSMTSKQYDSLVRISSSSIAQLQRGQSVIPFWLGLPVLPPDPYQEGFCKPRAMFPFNDECWELEYFSQDPLASISQNVQSAQGPDGSKGGSLELAGEVDSFIEIPNDGPLDATRSITLLAFVYPMGKGGPIICYDKSGLGVQLCYNGVTSKEGVLSASFIGRDLLEISDPLEAQVLRLNEWNFVGTSYDHNSGMARLWHNGDEVKTVYIGENLELATQFPIRIGAVINPFKGNYFKGRISLLHIYADALTAENIRAVGGIRNANAEGKNGDAQLQEGINAGEAVPQEEARTERGEERKEIACDKAAQREDDKNQEKVEEDEETNEDRRGIEKFKAKEKARETKKERLDQGNRKRQVDDDGDGDGDGDGDDDDDDEMENENENSVKDDVNSKLPTGVQLKEKANAIETEGLERGKDGEKEGDDQPCKSLGFQFDASIMEDNRILDTDEIIRFDTSSPLGEATAHDLYFNVERNEGVSKSGGWQFQNVREIRKKIKNLTQRKLRQEDMMNEKEAAEVCDVWILPQEDRWRLYRRWAYDARENCYEVISDFEEIFDGKANELQDLRNQEDLQILREKDVIGMTTTGAARYHSLLQKLQPAVTIVEEAAEVFEAHTVTALTPGCQQLILIGDHQQLRPSPTVYELAKDYNLDVSLFERMIENNLEYKRLCLQHRMRPEIAKMLDHIYVNPRLQNDKSVLAFEDIKGVERNLFFVDHNEEEELVREGRSKSNDHEAKFLAALCRYLIQQGYEKEQITILTAYSGQLLTLKNEMSNDEACFGGVHATVVDNFQGEENDIILLSLVRSNKIGFLKIANRVCVALSRARKGFYIIGNASLLDENDPDLWRKILTDMQEQGNLGRELKLVCQNHPQNVILASSATHFNGAPLGGCMEPCQKRMPDCEHTCPFLCHPIDVDHKEEFACRQPCTKIICERGHRCPKTCSEECGPCMVYVPKRIPSCGHEQNVPCSLDPSKFKCTQVVSKQAYPCGHFQDQVLCSVSPSDISCKNPCGMLECGHPCQGNCSSCEQGRLHLPCNSLCSRTLFCGHSCKDLCIKECPPCYEPCKLCGHPCQHPTNEHERQLYCTRLKCTELCENPCKKQRSDQPCQKQLSCGQIGTESFTEPSTKLCQVCNKNADVVREDEAGAMFVQLIDCGHVIERKELNLWMTKYEGSQDENKDIEIKQRRCPKCSTPIFCNLCNANIVSDAIADFEAVKRRIFLSNVVSKPQLEKIQKLKDSELQKLKDFGINIGEGLRETIGSRPVTTEQLTTYQNQLTFLSFLGKVWKKYSDAIEEKEQLHLRIYLLASRVVGERVCFSEQEIKEFTEELLRTELLAHLKWLTTALGGGAITLIPEDSERIEVIKDALESGKTIDRQRRKQFIDDVNKIHAQRLSGFNSKGKMVDSESSLKQKIVRRKNLTEGPWFKCVKAHRYSAAERIDGEGNIKCPECHAEAKGTAAKSQTVATRGLMRSHKKETRKEGRKPRDSNTWRRRPGKNAKFST